MHGEEVASPSAEGAEEGAAAPSAEGAEEGAAQTGAGREAEWAGAFSQCPDLPRVPVAPLPEVPKPEEGWGALPMFAKIGHYGAHLGPMHAAFTDKLRAKQYVLDVAPVLGLAPLLTAAPVLRVLSGPDDLKRDDLAAGKMVKATHGCKWNILGGGGVDLDEARDALRRWSETVWRPPASAPQRQYESIPPRFFVEQVIPDARAPVGEALCYMVRCIRGRAISLSVLHGSQQNSYYAGSGKCFMREIGETCGEAPGRFAATPSRLRRSEPPQTPSRLRRSEPPHPPFRGTRQVERRRWREGEQSSGRRWREGEQSSGRRWREGARRGREGEQHGRERDIDPSPTLHRDLIRCATALAAPFEFVRVDFHVSGERIYFSEFTFTPAGGSQVFATAEEERQGKEW